MFFRNLIWMSMALSAGAQTMMNGRASLVLGGKAAGVVVDLGGGSIVEFQFQDQRLNPLTWTSGESAPAHPMGHFLCLDRWGAPSEAESRNGMPFHGEASHVTWKIVRDAQRAGRAIRAELAATLPLAGFDVVRRVELSEDAALLQVSESITNTNKLGRVYNMVQHPSIASPFLDESTVVDANGRKGFIAQNLEKNADADTERPRETPVLHDDSLVSGILRRCKAVRTARGHRPQKSALSK